MTAILKVDQIEKADGSPVDLTGQSAAKATVRFGMLALQVYNSFNVSSLTDLGTGRPAFNLTSAMSDIYHSQSSMQQASAFYGIQDATVTASYCSFYSFNYNGTAQDLDYGSIQIFGDLA